MKAFWRARLREPSTWRGLAMLASGLMVLLGYSAEAEKLTPIFDLIAGGMVTSGVIGILAQDAK